MAFDVFIQLVPVLELRGQDLFPCYFGNFSVSSLADAANEVEALKSAVACLSHTEKPKGVNPFRERFAAPRLESVAKSDLCGRMELFRMKLRLDVGASSSDELEKCFMSLAQAMQSDSNLAMRAQAVEFQGYAARRLSELSSTTGSTLATKHYSELAIDIFQTRLIESGSPRFCKYMLFEAHIHGQLTSQGFWRLWQQLSESFLSCWEAQYGDAVTAALSKLTLNEAEQIEVEGLFRDLGRIPYVVTVMTLHSRSVKPSFVEFCDSYFKRIEAKLSRFYRRIVTPGISQGLSGSFGFAKECHQQFILLDWVRSAIANVGADVCNDEDLQTTGGFANLEILGLINVMTVFESELPLLTDQLKPMPANLGMLYFLIPELQSKLVEEFDRIVWPESRAADWIREFRAHLGEGEVS
ncbi:MAG: hypothetical protein MPJ50_12335 [Pirellulales bacterium]|nr:hypothetical protein [Pirellulales bacterium]